MNSSPLEWTNLLAEDSLSEHISVGVSTKKKKILWKSVTGFQQGQ
jgi:hypothetical protein